MQSSHSADLIFQQECRDSLIDALLVFRPYGNNARHGVPNQAYKITNAQLILRTYGSFPIRFEPSLPELLTVHSGGGDDKLRALFSISSLENVIMAQANVPIHDDLYTNMFRKVVALNRITSFDCLNHPVCQVFVVDHDTDTIETIRRMIVEFRNYRFPPYFQIDDLLVHVFVLYNAQVSSSADVESFLARVRSELSVGASSLATFQQVDATDVVKIATRENATVDQEAQRLSSGESPELSYLQVPRALDTALRGRLCEFVGKTLIPHMEKKVRAWDDGVLSPMRSITNRFFAASKKLFNLGNNFSEVSGTAGSHFNATNNYYHRLSAEQTIRKLADWSLMLKDFRYAYSTYDFIKKDFTNDKAWLYVASSHEMCIVLLLLAQSQPIAADTMPAAPDKNTLRKIRHEIVEPYIDNLVYTYKLRFNVKAYAIRAQLVVAELLLHVSSVFNVFWWWSDLIQKYLVSCVSEVDSHFLSGAYAIRALLFERLGYSASLSLFVPSEFLSAVHNIANQEPRKADTVEGGYTNVAKVSHDVNGATRGLYRKRKSALWYILSMREWMYLDNIPQIQHLLPNLGNVFEGEQWCQRDDLLLARIKEASGFQRGHVVSTTE